MKRILILCTGNSCRSQMAMGFLRAIDANLDVQSAGTNPTSAVNPYAIKAMAEVDIDLNNEQPKSVELYLKEEYYCPLNGSKSLFLPLLDSYKPHNKANTTAVR